MAEQTQPGSGGLLCVWQITDETIDRDDLIAEAYEQLDDVATEAGARVTGPSTWRVVDAADLEGWEFWPGQLLIATMRAEPLALAAAS